MARVIPGGRPIRRGTGSVTGSADGVPADALALTLLTAAGAQDTVAVKPPALESSQRFLDSHRALLGKPAADGPAHEDPAVARIKAMLLAGDAKNAFTQLYRMQKGLGQPPPR